MTLPPPAKVGDPLSAVDTPTLIVDLDPFERNLERMAQLVAGSGVRLRPHAKTHKCAEIARRQVRAGAVGVCAQKVSEAEALIDGGIDDVFISNEVVGARKLERLAQLARRARISVCVDDLANVADLERAAAEAGVHVTVLVEVDVGGGRCGVGPGEPVVTLARAVQEAPHLGFGGIHAYHGRAQHLRAVDERRRAIDGAAEQVRRTLGALGSQGLPCRTVTGAGTGTFLFEMGSSVYTELQPGSYVFMDADYGRNDWSGSPRFEQSLFVLTTVMSRPASDRAIVDAGLKALSVDSGMPAVFERPGLSYARASDEHGAIDVEPGAAPVALGERILLVPGHCDPTVNLYDWFVCTRKGIVEDVWPIARGTVY